MMEIAIPGWETLKINHLVCDYSGTLSLDGIMLPGVRERLEELSGKITIHVITADTHKRAASELKGIICEFRLIAGADQDIQKERYIKSLGAESVMAIGNGVNDRKMLAAAKVGVAVCLQEGLSVEALMVSKILCHSITDALDLLLFPNRLRGTLRK